MDKRIETQSDVAANLRAQPVGFPRLAVLSPSELLRSRKRMVRARQKRVQVPVDSGRRTHPRPECADASSIRHPRIGQITQSCPNWITRLGGVVYALNEWPQPQLFTALGFSKVKPRLSRPS